MKTRRRSSTDFATYRRLLSYLRGDGRIIAAVFVCIALESLFTVLTISSLKPVLNLLGDEPLLEQVESARSRPLELATPAPASDGRMVLRGAGEAGGRNAARRLANRLSSLAARPSRTTASLILDLADASPPDRQVWAVLFAGADEARQRGGELTVLLPSGSAPPPLLRISPGAGLRLVQGDPEAAARLRALYPEEVRRFAPPVPAAGGQPGPVARIKQAALDRITPYVVRLQQHAESSREAKFQVLVTAIGFMLGCAVFMVAAGFAVGYLANLLATRVLQKLRNHLFSHMLKLDLAHFTSHSTGSQMSVVLQDVQAVEGAVDILFSSVFKTPVTVLVLVSAMYSISPRLTLITFTVLPLMGILIYALGRRVRRTSSRIQAAKGALASILEEAFSGMRVVKAYNMEKREAERFEKENHRIFRLSLKTTAASEVGTSATQLLSVATVGIMVLLGGYVVVVTQELSYSDFLIFVALLTQVFRPLKTVPKTNTKLQRGLAGCDRVFGLLDSEPRIRERPGAPEARPLRTAIELRNVSLRYQEDRAPALNGINLRIEAGTSIALVGSAGCGKSTLANLIPRFYDPTEGQVTWDGTDLRDLSLASLRRQIALVTQDVILFDDTIANNIAFGAEGTVSREQIEAAARAARAHDFIMSLPQGYDTMVGGRGQLLSGGQRQRLAIARALVRNAPVLILDEATSALDSETEALLQEALAELVRGRTVLVIAHRLSTIQNCDRIYVMEQGRFVEDGPHDELLERNGRYARFYNIQFGRAPAQT